MNNIDKVWSVVHEDETSKNTAGGIVSYAWKIRAILVSLTYVIFAIPQWILSAQTLNAVCNYLHNVSSQIIIALLLVGIMSWISEKLATKIQDSWLLTTAFIPSQAVIVLSILGPILHIQAKLCSIEGIYFGWMIFVIVSLVDSVSGRSRSGAYGQTKSFVRETIQQVKAADYPNLSRLLGITITVVILVGLWVVLLQGISHLMINPILTLLGVRDRII